MNKKAFYDSIRANLFAGSLSQPQVNGIEAILTEYKKGWIDKEGKPAFLNDLRKLAYIFATVFHETAKTMQPIPEYGRGKNYAYGKQLKMSRQPYTDTTNIFYGRGLVQLTWYENYAQMGKFLGIDLINNPDLMLKMDVSVQAIFEGMKRGMFTGKSLGSYITEESTDFLNARRIINGTDKADLVKGYAIKFYNALISL